MSEWRKIETALADLLRSRGIAVAGGGDNLHFAATADRPNTGLELPTTCALMAQVGEDCGMKLRRVNLAELAQQLEEALR